MNTALSIAGTDPSGGAGLHADLKTFLANGAYGMAVVTAIVAQNTQGVIAIEPASPSIIHTQIEAVLHDIPPQAIKIGMTGGAPAVKVIAEALARQKDTPIILDPVMVSTSGHALIDEETSDALIHTLFPLAELITPNIPEAIALLGKTGMDIRDAQEGSEEWMERAAHHLLALGSRAVLVKGGHQTVNGDAASCDVLCIDGNIHWYTGKRIQTKHTHGTGCTLSAAITANRAQGIPLEQAVALAKEYLTGALSTGLSLGKGSGPLDHGWNIIRRR